MTVREDVPDATLDLILASLADKDTVFVFPSAVAADSRAAQVVLETLGAVDTRRFVAWDRFKEKVFRPEPGLAGPSAGAIAEPADRAARRLFALSVLRDNAETAFLSSLVRPEYKDGYERFVPLVERALPSLRRLAGERDADSHPLFRDWASISSRYDEWLSAFGWFEPSHYAKKAVPGGKRWILFWPELIDDWDEYRAAILSSPESFIPVSSPSSDPGPLLRFDAALTEVRYVLGCAGKLLVNGVKVQDISFTVPDLDVWRPFLEREAALYGVRLSFKAGKPLSSWMPGRLWMAIGRCASERFSYESVKALVLDGAWPFKPEERRRALSFLALGERLHAVAPWTEDGAAVDLWETTFARSPGGSSVRDALAFYRSLKGAVMKITDAPTFRAIADEFARFEHVFLDRSAWGDAGRVVERALKALTSLATAEERVGLHGGIDRYGAFLDWLGSIQYVFREGEAGIPVYDWRVSAGLASAHRFVLNCAQGPLSVKVSPYAFLPAHLSSGGNSEPLDVSDAFVRAYADIPRGGEPCVFTFSSRGPDGERISHSSFFGNSIAMKAGTAVFDAWVREDPFLNEKRMWASLPVFAKALPSQALSWSRASVASPKIAAPGWILSRLPVEDASFLDRVRSVIRDERGYFKASDSLVEDYSVCPFRTLFSRVLKVEEKRSGVAFVDALFKGTAEHEAARILFASIREFSGVFDPLKLPSYREMARAAVEEASRSLARKDGAFLEPVLECFSDAFHEDLLALLSDEAEARPGFSVVNVDEWLSRDFDDRRITLSGKIDRTGESEGTVFMVDYKAGKGSVVTPGKLRKFLDASGSGMETGQEGNDEAAQADQAGWELEGGKILQLPSYAELMGLPDDVHLVAGYWVFKDCLSKVLVDTGHDGSGKYPPILQDELAAARRAFVALTDRAARGMIDGYFGADGALAESSCEGCPCRTVCRTGFLS